jgi:hypothetical protein
MWVKIVKAVIAWLLRHHKWLIYEMAVPPGYHVHQNPPRKELRAKYPVTEQ